jgi:allophanate hydrolase
MGKLVLEVTFKDLHKTISMSNSQRQQPTTGAKEQYLAAVERMERIGGEPVLFDYKPWEDVARLLYGGASVAQRFLTYGNYVLDNKPTGTPITMNPDTDQLIDPTTYLILKNAYYNKATGAYTDEWAINLIKQ